MTTVHNAGPFVSFGVANGQPSGSNPDAGPDASYQGYCLLDPRVPYQIANQPANGPQYYSWFLNGDVFVLDYVPSTIAANNIAASQSPGAGAITLVSASGAGITAGVSIQSPFSNAAASATVTGLLAIDSAVAWQKVGAVSTFAKNWIWDITTLGARNVRITSGGNDSGITFTVSGYDIYGVPMHENITGANAGIASGKKAFKYISAVTHTGSVAGTLTIGTGDVYGIPMRNTKWEYLQVYWNGAFVSVSTGWLTADTTSPATATTGDVRGTYAVQSASDGSKRLAFLWSPDQTSALAATTTSTASLFGVTQF